MTAGKLYGNVKTSSQNFGVVGRDMSLLHGLCQGVSGVVRFKFIVHAHV